MIHVKLDRSLPAVLSGPNKVNSFLILHNEDVTSVKFKKQQAFQLSG